MRRPRKRWLLTLRIALVGALLTPLIATGLELSSRTKQAASPDIHVVLLPSDYAMIGWAAFIGLYLGFMVGLVVNAVAMIIEEPRPHW